MKKQKQTIKRLLDTQEAACYCNCCPATFKRDFDVQPIRVGTRFLYDVREIDKVIDRMVQAAANDDLSDNEKLLESL